MPCSTRPPAARAAASATSTRKACSVRNKSATSIDGGSKDGNPQESQKDESQGGSDKGREEGRRAQAEEGGEAGGREERQRRPAAAVEQALRPGRQGARRCACARLH